MQQFIAYLLRKHIVLYIILFYVATGSPYKCDNTISKKEKNGWTRKQQHEK